MKFIRCFSSLAAAAVCAAILTACAASPAVPAAAEPYSALRLHILANSDSAVDQAAKLAVRDAVLAAAEERYAVEEIDSSDEAKALLMDMGAELTTAAEEALLERGMDYGVQLVTGSFSFPDRVYGNMLYPAGDYSALRVILGDGAGQNWWCVMFPPLCVIDEPAAPAEYNEDGTLEFKSFFAELWRRIFG